MNPSLAEFAKENYPNTKSDLFAMFIERGFELTVKNGYSAMVTMQSWMFLSSYEKLRKEISERACIASMAHLGARAFDSIGGEVVQSTAFVLKNKYTQDFKGSFLRLVDGKSEAEKQANFKLALKTQSKDSFFKASTEDFKKIPGSPIAYWVSERVLTAYSKHKLSNYFVTRLGMATANNNLFVREWFEVTSNSSAIYNEVDNRQKSQDSGKKWFIYQKGGEFRKWYGNLETLVNWFDDGCAIRAYTGEGKEIKSHNYNLDFIFKNAVTWNALTSSQTSARLSLYSIFDNAGSSMFSINQDSTILKSGIAFLNSTLIGSFLKPLSESMNFQPGEISKLPFQEVGSINLVFNTDTLINISKADWDSYERSWDFKTLPLIDTYKNTEKAPLTETYKILRSKWQSMTDEMKKLEEENNKIFIEAYGLEEELTAEVPLKEITLTCNPHYRYDSKKSSAALEKLLLEDTIKEFISYAVGCMFGRYSLDKAGLILANQGETLNDYLKAVPEPSFMPDEDNVIPVLEEEWFNDDIVNRFKNFLKVSLGEDNYELNLRFLFHQIKWNYSYLSNFQLPCW